MRSIRRREDQCRTDDTCILRVGALEVGHCIGEILTCSYFQPVGDMTVDVHTKVITLETCILNDTLLISEAPRESIIALFRTTADTGTILLKETSLVNLILPVGTGHLIHITILISTDTRSQEVLRRGVIGTLRIDRLSTHVRIAPLATIGILLCALLVETAVGSSLVLIAGIGIGIKHLYPTTYALDTPRSIHLNLRLTNLPLSGGNDNDTIGTTRTVNGSSGCILQHLNLLDIIRIDHRQRRSLLIITTGSLTARGAVGVSTIRYTINDIQGLRTGGKRVGATYCDADTSTRRAVALLHIDTSNLSLHAVSHIWRTTCHEILALDLGDRAAEVAFLHRTIAYHDNLFHHGGILHKGNLDLCLTLHINHLGLIPNHRHLNKELPLRHREGEVSFQICHRSNGSTRHLDAGTNQRLVKRAVEDLTLNLLLGSCM